jgi:hypothetical protein
MKISHDDFSEIWVLLWSHKQQVFFHKTVGQMLERNLASYLHERNHDSDHIVVGFATRQEDIRALREKLRRQMDEPGSEDFHLRS